jgi:hypothetical protein
MKAKNTKVCSNITSKRTPCNNTKNTPNAHKRSPKASFIIHKMLLQILAARFTMKRMGERKKRRGEIWAA